MIIEIDCFFVASLCAEFYLERVHRSKFIKEAVAITGGSVLNITCHQTFCKRSARAFVWFTEGGVQSVCIIKHFGHLSNPGICTSTQCVNMFGILSKVPGGDVIVRTEYEPSS